MDDALQLSNTYRAKRVHFGTSLVFFIVNAITALIDSSLEDWGLPFASQDRTMNEGNAMDLDMKGGSDKKDMLRRSNTFTAFEVVENMSSHKKILVLLRLAHLNMYISYQLYMGGNHLTMGYFDNLDNKFSNKYEKNLKNRKKNLMGMFFYL
jgi:hypothetical protein